ncbi:response regulator transcription factor [Pseudomonas sp. NUPR-001]|uniref:response regulator transcription factor n=1 Tax=Pseudomonas sp. NUPR-001 TaxID=3416058 RepID=UPI003F94A4FA
MRLSDRETVVLSLIARGWTDRHIAEQLAIAFSTARKHRENLLAKLKVERASALVAIYLSLVAAPTWRAGKVAIAAFCA